LEVLFDFEGLTMPAGTLFVCPPHHAALVLDWKIVGTGNNGEKVYITGTSSDYAKKGPDGYWRCFQINMAAHLFI